MSRFTVVAVMLFGAAAGGCSSQDQLHFEERSSLESRTTSVVLYDNGFVGQGTMNEQSCQFDAMNGFILADYDLPTSEELMQDVRGQVAIARTIEGIHVIDEAGWDRANDIPVQGVKHVRMTDDGVASLIGDGAGCRVDWRNDDAVETVSLEAAMCDAQGFAVDPVSKQVWVATPGAVVTAQPGGEARALQVQGDLIAFDETTGNIYVAEKGGSVVTTVDATGDVVWTNDIDGSVNDLTDMGALGATVAVVEGNDVEIQVWDGTTGEQIADYELPASADVVVSADASTVALVTPETVWFYDVLEGSSPLVFNDVQTEPPPMFAD